MATKTVSRAEFAALTARLALIEERLAELQSAPTVKKAKKSAPAAADGEEKVLSPWLQFCSRITALLQQEGNGEAKSAAWPARLAFCSSCKALCNGEYETLTDDAILNHALEFEAPEKVAKPKKAAAEEAPAPKTPSKKKAAAAAEEDAPPAPKKKLVKKAAAAPAAAAEEDAPPAPKKKAAPPSPAPNPFAEEGDI